MDVGTRLNHYTVGPKLGSGGMGDVYRAEDTRLGREVAIKVLGANVAEDASRLARLQREARLLAQVNHPNIVTIYSIEEADGVHFITMELIDGATLDDAIAGEAMELDRFFELALQLVDAITTAHAKGITHRDLKPANVMIGNDGRVRVLDFGLAKTTPLVNAADGATFVPDAAITGEGVIVGTVAYMSPEQAEGKPVDQRSDIFSLGVLLHQMLTGKQPFTGDTPVGVLSSIIRDEPISVSEIRPQLPRHLGRILRRTLEKDPARRYQSTLDLRNDLADLLHELDSGEYGPPVADQLAAMSDVVRKLYRTPLVGRSDEVGQILAMLDAAVAGSGGMVMIGGEPGVGKTRLAWEIVERAREREVVALVGHCYEREGSPPYGPWVEIAETSAQITPAPTLRTLLGDAAPELAKLLPELRQQFSDIPPPLDLPPEESRRYLFKSFREFIERSAALRPLCLMLDDLHWADDSTLLLLQYLAPYLESLPVLIIGTYRNVELEVGRPFAGALRELVRERQTERINLRRLMDDGVREMIEALAGKEPDRALVKAIHDATEGNPFFVEEVYRHLEEEGRLFGADGEWLQIDATELDVPEGVRLVVGRRLEHLEPEALKILAVAAVAGRRFSYAVIEALPDVDPDTLLDTMEQAEQLQLIRPPKGRSREPRFVFTHELIRQTLLDGLLLPRRQRFHLQIAEAMERAYARSLDAHAGAIGYHLYQAGAAADLDKTVGFLQRGAELYLTAGGFEDVVARCDMALGVLDSETDDRVGRLRMLRGQAYRSLARVDEAIHDLCAALPTLARSAEREQIAECATDASNLLGWRFRTKEAFAVIDVGLAAVGDEPSAARCQLMMLQAFMAGTDEATLAGGLVALEGLIEEGRQLGDRGLMVHGMAIRAYLLNEAGRYAELLVAAREAAAASELQGLHWMRGEQLGMIALAHAYMAQPEEAHAASERALEANASIDNAHVPFFLLKVRERRAAIEGDLADFRAAAAEDVAWSDTHGGFRSVTLLYEAVGEWLAGDADAALAAFERSLDATEEVTTWLGATEAALMRVHAYAGRAPEVLQEWSRWEDQQLLAEAGRTRAAGARFRVAGGVESLAVIGRPELTAPWQQSLVELDADGPLAPLAGWVNLKALAGIAANAGGDEARAIAHFEEAITFARDLDFEFGLADAYRFYAQMLLVREADGDADRAKQMLGEAVEIYERLGIPIHAGHARRLLG